MLIGLTLAAISVVGLLPIAALDGLFLYMGIASFGGAALETRHDDLYVLFTYTYTRTRAHAHTRTRTHARTHARTHTEAAPAQATPTFDPNPGPHQATPTLNPNPGPSLGNSIP